MKKTALFYAGIFGIPLILALSIILYALMTFSLEDAPLSIYGLSDLGSPWLQKTESGYSPIPYLPADLKTSRSTVVIQNTIPSVVDRNSVLVVKLRFQKLRAYLDGRLIYEAGYTDKAPFGFGFGFQRNFIPILHGYEGKTISLEFFSPIGAERISVDSILFGNEVAAFIRIFSQNFVLVLLCIITLFVSVFFFVISYLIRFKFPDVSFRGNVFLGLFFLLTAFWLLTECDMLQFFVGHRTFFYLMSFYSFMLLSVPFLLFINELCHKKRKILPALCLLFSMNFVVCNLLYVFNIFDLIQTIVSTHVLIVTSIFSVLFVSISEIRAQNRDMKEITFGVVIIAITGLISLAYYYDSKVDYYYYFGFGIMLFNLLMGAGAFKKILSLVNASISASTYKTLAYTDSMTGLGNRAAFSEALDKINREKNSFSTLAFMIFDIDNLKPVNDTLGHMSGDELIKGVADCLRVAFSGAGQCFRIGGDEFAVILAGGSEDELVDRLRTLDKCIDKYNYNNTGKIALSLGFEFCGADELLSMSVYDIFNRADAKMYEHKKSKERIQAN